MVHVTLVNEEILLVQQWPPIPKASSTPAIPGAQGGEAVVEADFVPIAATSAENNFVAMSRRFAS